MRDLGEFVSVFRRALRDQFEYRPIDLKRILLVTDLEADQIPAYQELVQHFLDPEFPQESYQLKALGINDWTNWADLRIHVDDEQPDLVVTYRRLRAPNPEMLTSLGVFVDSLTQITPYPVLLMPNPHYNSPGTFAEQLGTVVVATEHRYADHSLINFGIRFTPIHNSLFLCHIEDEATFEYYMKAIEKIPEIDNEVAREKIAEQLREMPLHYSESVAEQIRIHDKRVQLTSVIEVGNIIDRYRDLIAREPVSLLVFTTKDDTQLAMHSLGHSLAVEFRDLPVLLI